MFHVSSTKERSQEKAESGFIYTPWYGGTVLTFTEVLVISANYVF